MQLDVVVRAFDAIISNSDQIDFNMASFSEISYLKGLNDKLKTFQNSEKFAQITLDFEDWTIFFPYLQHSVSAVYDIKDAEILHDLYEKYL